MKKLLLITLLCFSSAPAMAKPIYLQQMKSVFSEVKLSFECYTCHSSIPRLNNFGKDFVAHVRNGVISDIQTWREMMSKDSDGDKVINSEEIGRGTNPGEAE